MRICQRAICLCLVLACAIAGLAQQATGIISGTVQDPGERVVGSAKVTALNTGTGYARTFRTSNDGRFTFPALPIGTYSLVAEGRNFRPTRITGLQVTEGHELPVKVRLLVGSVDQEVTITAQTPMVQTEDATSQRTFTGREIVRFGVDSLVATIPQNTGGGIVGWLTINGGRTENNRWMLDGSQNQESLNRTEGSQPDIESIQEINVISTLAKAEQGQSSAQINVVTKSGTDQFHGHVAIPLPNAWSGVARNFFQARTVNPDGKPVDPNSTGIDYYSASLGGPLVLPHLYNGRKKTHFFYPLWRRAGKFSGPDGSQFRSSTPTEFPFGGSLLDSA